MGGMSWGWMFFGPLVGLLLVVGISFGIYHLIRSPRKDDALMVLRRRFAQGEISEEEFQRRRDLLKQ